MFGDGPRNKKENKAKQKIIGRDFTMFNFFFFGCNFVRRKILFHNHYFTGSSIRILWNMIEIQKHKQKKNCENAYASDKNNIFSPPKTFSLFVLAIFSRTVYFWMRCCCCFVFVYHFRHRFTSLAFYFERGIILNMRRKKKTNCAGRSNLNCSKFVFMG